MGTVKGRKDRGGGKGQIGKDGGGRDRKEGRGGEIGEGRDGGREG